MDSNKEQNNLEINKENIDKEALKEERKKAKLEKKQMKADAKEKKEKKQTEEKQEKKIEKVKEAEKPKVYYESNAKLIRANLNQPVHVKDGQRNILITSALPYVNNVPHLGNLIGCVLSADVYARYCRLMGYNTLYICGTDEYGTATETKAIEEKCTPKELCDKFHEIHKGIYEWFDCDFDFFGRTSTPIHTEITQEIFNELFKNGYIKKNQVEQLKCTTCNIFLADRYVIGKCYQTPCTYEEARGDQCDGCGKLCNALELIDPKCKQCKSSPILATSMHYYLELPEVEKRLKEWVQTTSLEGKWSNNSKTITNSFINEGLKPRCITRDLKWGVEVPTEEEDMKNKVFYVWFDAPIGYLSITANFIKDGWEKWWKNPEDVKLYQFMGKDNVTFHTVIFPSTLLGTQNKYTLVYHLSTTEYLNYENKKFSKTHSTGVFGDSAKNTGIPSEVWRYYLLANRPEQSDTDFKWDDFQAKNNNELLSNLGNFVNRVLKFTAKNFQLKVPKFNKDEKLFIERDLDLLVNSKKLLNEYINSLENVKIKDGLRVFMEISSLGNSYLQETEPWALMKSNPERVANILYIMINFVRLLGCLAEPYMPSFSAKLYELIKIQYDKNSSLLKIFFDVIDDQESFNDVFLNLVKEDTEIIDPLPLFKEITAQEIAEFKKIYG